MRAFDWYNIRPIYGHFEKFNFLAENFGRKNQRIFQKFITFSKLTFLKNFKSLQYAENSALSRKNTFGTNRRQKSRNFSKKPKNFWFFEIRPLRVQFRLFLKFSPVKKHLIFYSILWRKPHPNSSTPKKVMVPQKIPKIPQKGYPFGNKGWDKIFEFWPEIRLIWCFDTR